MPRIRTIKPEFWTNPQVVHCPFAARLLFIGTWNFADDHGNLPRDAEKLKLQVFPGDDVDVGALIDALIAQGLLIEYSVSDQCYLHIPTFRKHQVINRPSRPLFPLPDKDSIEAAQDKKNVHSLSTPERLTEHSSLEGSREGSKEQGSKPKTTGTKGRTRHNPRARAYTRETPAPDDLAPTDRGDRTADARGADRKQHDPTLAELPPGEVTIKPAMLSAAMRRHSISASPSDPRVIAAARNGITPGTVEAACVEAKESDPTGRIRAGYVLAIAERWTEDAGRMHTRHANGHANATAPPRPSGRAFDERAEDRKRAIGKLTGADRKPTTPSMDVIDVETHETRHEPPDS